VIGLIARIAFGGVVGYEPVRVGLVDIVGAIEVIPGVRRVRVRQHV